MASAVFLPGKPDLALPGRNIGPLRWRDLLGTRKPVLFKMVQDAKGGKTETLSQREDTKET